MEGGTVGIQTGSGARIINNYIFGIKQAGITTGHGSTLIEGNEIVMSSTASDTSMGIVTWGATIRNNVVHNGAYGGIWAQGDYCRVVGNTVISGGKNNAYTGGIVLMGGKYNFVSNNVVKNGVPGSSCILIRGNAEGHVIIGNSVTGCTHGIREILSEGYGNNLITNNIVMNNTNNIIAPGVNTELHENIGHTTENGGVTPVSNGQSIPHGLVDTPSYYVITPTVPNRVVAVISADSTHLTISLTNTDGNPVTSPEDISWYAEV